MEPDDTSDRERSGPQIPPAETVHEPERDPSPPRRTPTAPIAILAVLIVIAALVVALVVAAVRSA
jgi:hypothetical protein